MMDLYLFFFVFDFVFFNPIDDHDDVYVGCGRVKGEFKLVIS